MPQKLALLRILACRFDDPRELALLRWTDVLSSERGAISDEITGAMQDHFSPAEIVELTMIAGATIMLNRYCTALALPTSDQTLERLEAEDLA